ncbi:MAG: TlpA family protein disulfide reductase [Planctomycetes bacterium]|nr:TlpA family protein disulfide reductase [Planctomycetota bacterium]
MFPHERSLVEKLKDAPFALVGVNSDDNFEELKKKEYVEEKITWRSFQNRGGEKAIDQQTIADDWGVQGWPTLYLIDAAGNVRKKWSGSPGDEILDAAIEKLVAEANGGGVKSSNAKPAAPKKDAKKGKSGK